jgi:hypothetical protein
MDAAVVEVEVSDEELTAMIEEAKKAEEERNARLDQLGVSIATMRSEAISGREASGIETEWLEE